MWANLSKNPKSKQQRCAEIASPALPWLLPRFDDISMCEEHRASFSDKRTKPGKSCTGKPQLWAHLPANLLCTGVPLAANLWEALLWPFPGAETPWHYAFWHALRGYHSMQCLSTIAWNNKKTNKKKETGMNGINLMFQIWYLTGLSLPVCQCQQWFDCINQLWFFPGCQGWNNL